MYLELEEFRIEKEHLTYVTLPEIGGKFSFQGLGREEEGKKITEKLKKFRSGEKGIKYKIETDDFKEDYGLCEILEIKIEEPKPNEFPSIYKFSGELKKIT